MNILRIVYEWPPPWDGLAPAPYEVTAAQARLGHKIDVICARWPFSGPIEKLNNVTLHPLIREPLKGTLLVTVAPFVLLYYFYYRAKNKPDVIHAHGHFGAYYYFYRRFLARYFPKAKELSIPLVAHFHNTVKGRWVKLVEDKANISPISEKLDWPLAERSDKAAIETADAYVFVSEDVKKEAIKYYGANPNKCHVVETGVNTELFVPIGPEEKAKTRAELGLDPYDIVILNNGAIVERKNIHVLVESLRLLPARYRLLLVGPYSQEDYENKISSLVVKYGLKNRIVRVGYTPYPQVPIAFQAADVFVLPSSWEGLPKVVMQSLSCSVPVLASGFKTKEQIKGLNYLEEISPEAIARQVQEVVNGGESADHISIRSMYSWNVVAKRIDGIYNNLLTQNKQHA